MKTPLLFLGLALLPALFAAGPIPYNLKVGSTLEEAKTELGAPRGSIANGDSTTYFFAAGEATFRDGKLISCSLKSTEELAEQARVAEAMRKESAERMEKARAERLARGERLRLERSRDPGFLAQTASARLASWREFRVQYPETNIQAELDATFREWQVESSEQQLAELKEKVANLSAQLAAKEREAADLRSDRDSWKNRFDDLNRRYPRGYVVRDVIIPVPVPTPTPVPPRSIIIPLPPSQPLPRAVVLPTPVPAPVRNVE